MKRLFLIAALAAALIAGPSIWHGLRAADTAAIALRYAGLHEVKNRRQLKLLLGLDPARVRWCARFAGLVLRQAGLKPPRGDAAVVNWRRWGRRVAPRRGVVVVFRHNHVGILMGFKGGRVCVISGNWRDSVGESCSDPRSVQSYRAM